MSNSDFSLFFKKNELDREQLKKKFEVGAG